MKLIFSPQCSLIKRWQFLPLLSHLDLNGYFLTRLLSLQYNRTVFTLEWRLSSIKKLSAEPESQVMVLWARSQWGEPGGKALPGKKCFIIWSLDLMEFSSDLAERSHSEALTRPTAWTCSKWAPDSQWCMQPLGVRGHRAANQPRQVECRTAAAWLRFPTPPYPRMAAGQHAVSATLSHLCVWRACPQCFFLRTSSASLPLALSSPLFPKLLISHLGGWTQLLPPYILPAKSKEKDSGPRGGFCLLHFLQSTMT